MGTPETEKKIMELHKRGMSNQAISDFLNNSGIPAFRGGIWHKGTVGNLVKRLKDREITGQDKIPSPKPADTPKPEPDTLRKAYHACLKELDKVKEDLNRKCLELDAEKAENQRLVNQLNKVKQQQDTVSDLSPLMVKLSQMETELAQLRALFSPVKEDRRTDGKTVDGWNVVCSGGYYRAFRRIKGKMQSVYIGKTFDIQKARQRIADKEKELMTDNVYMLNKVKQDIPKPDDRADAEDPKADRKEFRYWVKLLPGEGRFVRIYRIRCKLNWSREKFDRVLTDLLADYAVEVHRGDPSILTEQEIKDSYKDENGTLYITLSWWEGSQRPNGDKKSIAL
jgi:hypothetical protein